MCTRRFYRVWLQAMPYQCGRRRTLFWRRIAKCAARFVGGVGDSSGASGALLSVGLPPAPVHCHASSSSRSAVMSLGTRLGYTRAHAISKQRFSELPIQRTGVSAPPSGAGGGRDLLRGQLRTSSKGVRISRASSDAVMGGIAIRSPMRRPELQLGSKRVFKISRFGALPPQRTPMHSAAPFGHLDDPSAWRRALKPRNRARSGFCAVQQRQWLRDRTSPLSRFEDTRHPASECRAIALTSSHRNRRSSPRERQRPVITRGSAAAVGFSFLSVSVTSCTLRVLLGHREAIVDIYARDGHAISRQNIRGNSYKMPPVM